MMFAVVVQRVVEATVYVEAASEATAREAARELADTDDFEQVSEHVDPIELVAFPADCQRYWFGGEHGHWVDR